MTFTLDTTVIGLLISGLVTGVGILWKLFSFTKTIDDKTSKAETNLINEELMELQHKVEALKEAIHQKADKAAIDLLKQDLEFVRKMMVTKEDLLKLEGTIREMFNRHE